MNPRLEEIGRQLARLPRIEEVAQPHAGDPILPFLSDLLRVVNELIRRENARNGHAA